MANLMLPNGRGQIVQMEGICGAPLLWEDGLLVGQPRGYCDDPVSDHEGRHGGFITRTVYDRVTWSRVNQDLRAEARGG
jgi:hypothetical protein